MSAYPRPGKDTTTERVWQIADAITERTGRRARRKDVIDAYVGEGGNPNTASTQYYYWSQSQPGTPGSADGDAAGGGDLGPLTVPLDAAGRLALPPEVRAAMGVGPAGVVTLHVRDGELVVLSQRAALDKLRRMARAAGGAGAGVVDGLIAERRAEAARE